ncbi:pilus assembly protein [Demequina sp. NBRC 110053]|uniref:pilus assembly protein n=1 Tax=Demequina sp. NBRC 110053 TaxID=1570342 RepID=UPI00118699DF|nr:pilus assembly protein [Demequina sp. NBRC 110053]
MASDPCRRSASGSADACVRRRDDAGGALVEFLGVTVLLLVPLVYAVIAIAQVQAATYAAEGASAAAARGAALAISDALDAGASETEAIAAAGEVAGAMVTLAVEDFDVNGEQAVELACGSGGCVGSDGEVVAHVALTVPLPGIPSFLADAVPLEVEVSAQSRADAGLLWTP